MALPLSTAKASKDMYGFAKKSGKKASAAKGKKKTAKKALPPALAKKAAEKKAANKKASKKPAPPAFLKNKKGPKKGTGKR